MAYATPDDVAANLGRPLTETEARQVTKWIGWAEGTIERRMGDLSCLNGAVLNMVIVEAVTRRVKMPDAVTQKSVQVDDAMISSSYATSTGLIDILPEWWAELGWRENRGAFSIGLAYTPDRRGRAWR